MGSTGEEKKVQNVYQDIIIGEAKNTEINQIGKVVNKRKIIINMQWHYAVIIPIIAIAAVIGPIFLLEHRMENNNEKMTGLFNVAIVGFDVVSSEDEETNDQVMALSETVKQLVDKYLEEMTEGSIPIEVWGPGRVGQIRGASSVERAKKAEQLARVVGADIVIYGEVDDRKKPWKWRIEFYVPSGTFYEAQDLFSIYADSGVYQLGEPIVLYGLESTSERVQVSKSISSKISLLSRIVMSLAYSLPPTPDYEKALSFLTDDSIQELNGQSLKVVDVIAGNIAGSAFANNMDESYLSLSKSYYTHALTIDSQYSRAYIGLGSVCYMEALWKFYRTRNTLDIDLEKLEQAKRYYQDAVKVLNQPLLADIEVKSHFGLGQVYLLQWMRGDVSAEVKAIQEFMKVIREYEVTKSFRIRELASESHARLGLIYSESAPTKAAEEYQKAADLAEIEKRKELFQRRAEELNSMH